MIIFLQQRRNPNMYMNALRTVHVMQINSGRVTPVLGKLLHYQEYLKNDSGFPLFTFHYLHSTTLHPSSPDTL